MTGETIMAENVRKRQATKKKMQDALMELYSQYEFQKITVTLLCKECGLHRSTFYLYYNSVDEILREIEHDILAQIREFSGRFNVFGNKEQSLEEIIRQTEPHMIEFYEWQFTKRHYLNPLLGAYGDPYFIQHYEEIIQEDIRPALAFMGYDSEKHPYLLKYVTGGVVKTNIDWLQHGDISPKELVILQRTMVFKNPIVRPRF